MEGLAKIGPWGGGGGKHRDIAAAPHHLQGVVLRCDGAIDSLAFTYTTLDGASHTAGPWGGSGGKLRKVKFADGEVVTEVSGTHGSFGPFGNIVTSLTFVTNAGEHGPFGKAEGTAFRVPVQGGGRVVGFFARSGSLLDAIGVYVHP